MFEKVNTGGVTLSMFELVTASFAAQDENLSLREDWDIRRNRLHGAFGALAALYVELGDQLAPAVARAKLERWFWSGIFGEVYGGAVETQYGLDLAQVVNWVRGGAEPTLVSEANFVPERLLSLRTRNSAAYKGLYALQMKSGAADWRTGDQLAFAT